MRTLSRSSASRQVGRVEGRAHDERPHASSSTRRARGRRRLLRLLTPVILLGAMRLGAGTAQATLVEGLGIADLTGRADLVVHGEVVEVKAAWNAGHDRILTTVTVEIADTLKGDSDARKRSFWQWGGTVDGTTLLLVGTPTFREKEEVVLFLRRSDIRVWDVVGLAQGKLKVEVDRTSGSKRVHQDTTGLEFARRRAGSASVDGMSFAELVRQVEAETGKTSTGAGRGRP